MHRFIETSPSHYNLLEPDTLLSLFRKFPPQNFDCEIDSSGIPFFNTSFDVLTTLDAKSLRKLKALPFADRWSQKLRLSACFIGTTLSEYAPLPSTLSPEQLLVQIQSCHAQAPSLTIVKDLPCDSPLLSHEENSYAEALRSRAERLGFFSVEGQALAYMPINFNSCEEYLSRLSSGRRKDLRRKMKKKPLLDLQTLPLGHSRFGDQGFLDELYGMYLEVFNQSEIHFDLLTPGFFTALLQSGLPGVVFLYLHDGVLAGYNICLIHGNMLIDKYIGFRYPLARDLNLYFISWLTNLEYALAEGLSTYIAGWTDPEVKAGLGASFTFTRHLVWVRNPLLRRILYPLRGFFEGDRQRLEARS